MNLKLGVLILAGALFGAAALMPAVSEGRGGRGGNGGGRGQCAQTQQSCRQQNPNCPQDRQRLRDGSCGNANCPQQGTPPAPNTVPNGGTPPPDPK